MKPTREQEKKFWEGLGWKLVKTTQDTGAIWADYEEVSWWKNPLNGKVRECLPTVSHDNLLQYAVPKLNWQQIIFQPNSYCGVTVNGELYEAEDLFWDIWETIKNKV